MSEGTERLDRALSVFLTVAAIVALGFLIEGRMNRSVPVQGGSRVTKIKDWASRSQKRSVSLDGMVSAPIQVEVFTDFECPFCRRMDSVIAQLSEKYPGKINRSLIHFPLNSHRYARAAAIAFECARRQERGKEMHGALYAGQSSFGSNPWLSLAIQSGISDTSEFASCLSNPNVGALVDSGVELGKQLTIWWYANSCGKWMAVRSITSKQHRSCGERRSEG